ncbi:DUF262 domain-containing protein [Aeromicrobium sp. Leaf291]|uniref:DUF262 domain-containing protein n=1 Tax=Aeromicrobium sp. Leaf291 TaxID=1736325 RepID=UPI0006F76CEB|nr:DUF262 domain-containing protein [Aeromicrobium sp. Leaf291]KQP82147.1 hypothetical protein ASF35_11920 [Aeromicrobium sp. Leaf291]
MTQNPAWSKDELILALDLYLYLGGTNGLNASHPHVIGLSNVLRHLPVHGATTRNGVSFRTPASVALKLHNFASIDPDHEGVGMSNAGGGDTWAWRRWRDDEEGLRHIARAILVVADLDLVPSADPAESEFDGGRLLFRYIATADHRTDIPDDARAEIQRALDTTSLTTKLPEQEKGWPSQMASTDESDTYAETGRHRGADDADAAFDLHEDVVQLVVELSRPSPCPIGIVPAHPVEMTRVDFESNGWLASIYLVQGWLNLGVQMISSPPRAGLESLASALDPVQDLIDQDATEDRPRLTSVGLEVLHARLERAVDLKQTFLADLEAEGTSLEVATAQWVQAWDDIANDEDEEPTGPFVAKANQWSINTFASRAARGELDLAPSYQRADVWPTADAQLLIESVLRGIPLPSVIVLTPTEASGTYEIVDGKQRLTAILRFMGRHPTALRHVEELDDKYPTVGFSQLFRSDYPAFRKAYNKHTPWRLSGGRERELQLPYRLRSDSKGALAGDLKELEGKYYTQIKQQRIWIAGRHTTVEDLFEIGNEYQIPVLEYSNATRRQIHEVFNLYNKQGKHLNAEEIRNAVYHNLDLMRGLLVASGDNPNLGVVAPFLTPVSTKIAVLPEVLEDYNIGTTRYKRTKLLSWIAASLLVDSTTVKGSPFRDDDVTPSAVDPNSASAKSTAKLITDMFDRVDRDDRQALRRSGAVVALVELIDRAVTAHAACDAKDGGVWASISPGAKWQELQLVATITGVALATLVRDEDLTDDLEDISSQLHSSVESDEHRWHRPKKTQSRSQASYIGFVALNVMEMLGVSAPEADAALRQRFGMSGVKGHEVARQLHVWGE